jgi:hypothetical protein
MTTTCSCVLWLQPETEGGTALYVASDSGHVECVRALLDGGAAINQATVRCAMSLREPRVRGYVGSCVCACAAGWVRWDGTRWRALARGDGAHAVL